MQMRIVRLCGTILIEQRVYCFITSYPIFMNHGNKHSRLSEEVIVENSGFIAERNPELMSYFRVSIRGELDSNDKVVADAARMLSTCCSIHAVPMARYEV